MKYMLLIYNDPAREPAYGTPEFNAMMGGFFIIDDPIFGGLAVSLIFGLFVSTLLTLFVIPVVYYHYNWRKA